jgi:hypothetical protein
MKINELEKIASYFDVSVEFLLKNVLQNAKKHVLQHDYTCLQDSRKSRLEFNRFGECTINDYYDFHETDFDGSSNYFESFAMGYLSYNGWSSIQILIDDYTGNMHIKPYRGIVKLDIAEKIVKDIA